MTQGSTAVKRSFLLALAGMAAACSQQASVISLPQAARTPPVMVDPLTGERSVYLSVMTYNVAGLPWPIRNGTSRYMDRIKLAMREAFARDRPDFLLLQEAFVPSSRTIPADVGYRYVVRGPGRPSRRALTRDGRPRAAFAGRGSTEGGAGPVINSGLALATNYSISANASEAFGEGSCAGYDCLANKGVMLVTVRLPGLPEPLFLLNTHLNSRLAAGVSQERSLAAYRRQVQRIDDLLTREWQQRGPLIYAGDFNSRHALSRFDYLMERLPGELAHRSCYANPDDCRTSISWTSDSPWMQAKDLQGYADGQRVRIQPVAMTTLFSDGPAGPALSDHDALMVTYHLRWMPEKGFPIAEGDARPNRARPGVPRAALRIAEDRP